MTAIKAFDFVGCPSGGFVFGYMPEHKTYGWNGLPIKLQYGYEGPKGYGLLHVEGYSSRIKQLQGLNFGTFEAFAHSVATGYTHIYAAKDPNRFQLAYHQPGYSYYIVVQLCDDPLSWTITTGLPSRPIKANPLWIRKKGDECEPSSTAPEPRSRFTTLSLPQKMGAQGQ
ncbi:MAG TPA: hypothetical protein VLT37_06690 [Acidocella sp.]|nr:hypothetical protein [Acidocella sp.]